MGVILLVVGTLFYYFGMADLVKAKGYSSAIIIAIIILGFCAPLVSAFIMTPVVLFVLKDKNARYRDYRSQSRQSSVSGRR